MVNAETEDLLRRLTPQVLGAVARRYGHFDLAKTPRRKRCWQQQRSGPRTACRTIPRRGWSPSPRGD
jgi:hypothetical protein